MKTKFLLVIAFLAHILAYSQSQRLILVEEFTQASCGPCAQQNPAFNSMLQQNTSKAVSVKYQTDFPGTDPMNAQNPQEIKARVNYYAVGGVPTAVMDGVVKGAPANITQAAIDNEYAVSSPFTIQVTHWFNSANDSVFVNCAITCSQNINMTTPKFRLAMIEKTITFATAPGSNGEKVFYNVMRKMYPNASGSVLPVAWTSNQKKTISFAAKIPTYIYKKTEIAFVAWIQDDANKNVAQAAFSSTPSSPLNLAPEADFTSADLTSCDGIVSFKDQSGLFPKSWLWDFGDGTTSTLQNPKHKYNASGAYTVKLTATNANGSNQAVKASYINVTLSGTEPSGTNDTRCGPGIVNLSAAPAGSGTLNWYNSTGSLVNTGTTYSPSITGTTNFWVAEMTANPVKSEGPATNTIGAGATFTATVTHGLYFDVLKPSKLVSVLCYASAAGPHTIQVVDAGGAVIQTASPNIPSGTSTVTLNFTLPAGTGYLLQCTNPANLYRNTAGAVYPYNASGVVKITGATAAGAYYYFFYDWKVQQDPCASPSKVISAIDSCTSTGIQNPVTADNPISISPNPSNGIFNLSFRAENAGDYTLKITNALGQVVHQETLENFSGEYTRPFDLSFAGKGVYLFSISTPEKQIIRKAILY